MILPGIKLGMQALFTGTAQLPDIRIEAPAHVICTETVESLQAGAVYGAAAMTDGLVERMESELGRPCTAVVTGGLGRFVVPHCRRRLVYDEHLLLRGLGMIWRRAGRNSLLRCDGKCRIIAGRDYFLTEKEHFP